MELAIKGLKKLSAKLKVDLKDLFLAGGSSGSDYIFIEPVCIEKNEKPIGDIIVEEGKLTVRIPSKKK